MKHFLLFLAGLVAAIVLISNLWPLVLLGVSLWLLYLIFKQFVKSESIVAKICWTLLGLVILSIGITNLYAVLGIAAAFVLYLVYKNWNKSDVEHGSNHHDPFMNFEHEWGNLNK